MIAELASAAVRCNSMISNVGRRQSYCRSQHGYHHKHTRGSNFSHSQSWRFATATPATFATVEVVLVAMCRKCRRLSQSQIVDSELAIRRAGRTRARCGQMSAQGGRGTNRGGGFDHPCF